MMIQKSGERWIAEYMAMPSPRQWVADSIFSRTPMLTPEILHDEALRRFAALTRHKDNPQSLRPPFAIGLAPNSPQEGETGMSLSFGKRYYAFTFPSADLDMTIHEFGDKHLAGAAQALLDSNG